MTGYLPQLLAVVLLLLLNAFFAGAEFALVSLRDGQLRSLERQSATGRTVAALARNSNRYLATIQLGTTLAGFLASATAAVTLSGPLVGVLGFLGEAARPTAVVLVTALLVFLTLVLAEMTPKRLAMQHPQQWALAVARPLVWLATLSAPAVWLLGRTTDLAVRLLGGDPTRQRVEVTPEEIREIVTTQRGFSPEQRLIMAGAVEMVERRLADFLIPREDVFTVDVDEPPSVARLRLAASGHSRAPVVRDGDLDTTLGVVHLRNLVAGEPDTVAEAARPAMVLPDTLPAAEALRRFRASRQRFALVRDGTGSVRGIVTLEDVVEEVMGEFHEGEEPADRPQ